MGEAQQPRLAARGRAPVARLELVDQRDLAARAGEQPGERRAERAGADDDGVGHAPDATVGRAVIAADLPPRIDAGDSVRGAPIVAVRTGAPNAPVRVLVTGSIHGNETAGPRGDRAAAADRPAGRRAGVDRAQRQPRRGEGAARARTPAASTSTATSRAAGAAAGGAFDTYFPGREAGSEPETKALMRLVAADPARDLDPLPPAHAAGEPRPGRRPRDRPPLRAPRRPPRHDAAELPRDRHRLAEPRVPRHERVRGRAAGGRAEPRRRAAARDGGARASRAAGSGARRRAAAQAADRLLADPVRRPARGARCATTRGATTASRPPA